MPTDTPDVPTNAQHLLSDHPRLRVGRRFGKLTVIGKPFYVREDHGQRRTLCVCECDCGQYTIARSERLLKGNTKSCGCQRGKAFAKKPVPPRPAAPAPPTVDGLTHEQLVQFYRASYSVRLAAKGVSAATMAHYEVTIRQAPTFISLETVTAWIATSTGAAATRNRKCRYLMAVLRAARRQELLKGLWIEDVPASATTLRVPRAWTSDEFSQLLAACDSLDETYLKIPASLWWRSFLMSIWYTGCRVKTLLAARTEDFDRRDGSLLVTSPKDHCEILYTLPMDAVAAIVAMGHVRLHIWPWPFDDKTKTMLRRMRDLISRAGLPQVHQPFHAIRRSVASYVAAELGINAASEALHHCRPQITKDHYLDPRIVNPRVSVGKTMPAVGGKGSEGKP